MRREGNVCENEAVTVSRWKLRSCKKFGSFPTAASTCVQRTGVETLERTQGCSGLIVIRNRSESRIPHRRHDVRVDILETRPEKMRMSPNFLNPATIRGPHGRWAEAGLRSSIQGQSLSLSYP